MHSGKTLYKNTNGIEVVDCVQCGYAHVTPLPTLDQLSKYYEEQFYQNSKTSYFDDFERDDAWWRINYLELLEKFRILGDGDKGNRLLDIGSGPGLFLDVANKQGFDVVGIEPSKLAYEYSVQKYKLNIINSTLEQLAENNLKFDFINSYLVLEHIMDPLQFLKLGISMLNQNGLFCVVVPNDFNPIQMINLKLGKKQWWVSPLEHLNYFNRQSLSALFNKAGLDVVYETVTFPIDLFLLMGKDYLADSSLGKDCHAMRKTLEFNFYETDSLEIKQNLYDAFAKSGLGRELVIIGKKR